MSQCAVVECPRQTNATSVLRLRSRKLISCRSSGGRAFHTLGPVCVVVVVVVVVVVTINKNNRVLRSAAEEEQKEAH